MRQSSFRLLHDLGQTQDALTKYANLLDQGCSSTSGGSVGNEDAVGQSANEAITLFGKCGRDPFLCRRERRG